MSTAEGFIVPVGGGRHFDSSTPGRSFAMKLLGRETNESIMMFEETLPAGTASTFHLHHYGSRQRLCPWPAGRHPRQSAVGTDGLQSDGRLPQSELRA
jgi:hypothetical protein